MPARRLLHGLSGPLATVVGTGAIGAYTTFSSIARDALALAEAGRRWPAVTYVAATCAVRGRRVAGLSLSSSPSLLALGGG